ncbi:MAG: hypothetical protein LIP77_07115 [Planctomycetes bacterium]|nr:hypothetical protein [Planctomycetota bacterium]
MTTASIEKIDARLAGIEPDSLRHRVLVALQAFRASWVTLGGLLIQMAYGGDYKDAGYDDFEVYCARELGLKKPTVQKLMISYNYMKKYEAARLAALEDGQTDTAPGAPEYTTIELLDRVRRDEAIPQEEAEEIHRQVFGAGGTASEKDLRRELREKLRPAPTGAVSIEMGGGRKLAAVVRAARRLRLLLSTGPAVPEGLRGRLETALCELEALE